ncbi:N-carbamoylputrescine amidase [Rhizobiales bacterium GAS191]|nr:N-carbamoylputrescine amidase [Rhizobiales bacterium GAS191]
MTTVRGGLIQMGLKASTDKSPEEIAKATLQAHLPLIEKAGQAGVQVLCFQEVFNQPYFCPSQDPKWYAAAERVPDGPTVKLMQELAQRHQMVIVVPIYEEAMIGVYYNTAAVIDADGSYLGKCRKAHIPQVAGFWEKFFFKPGASEYPVFHTRYCKLGVYICYDRHFPEGWRALALSGAEYIVNPSATVAGLSEYLWKLEQPAAAVANGVYIGAISGWHRSTVEHRRVLRPELFRQSSRADRGDCQPGQGRAPGPRHEFRYDPRSAQHVAVLP